MPLPKSTHCGLTLVIFITASVLILGGISSAREINGSDHDVSSSAALTEKQPPPHPEVPGSVKTTQSGSYYKIDENSSAYYEKPRMFGFLVNAPLDIVDWLKESFQQKNTVTIAALAVATGGLIAVDQDLYRFSRNTGRSLKITDDDTMKGRIPVVSGISIQYPTNFGSALYFLGDGMIPISITAGMLGYGLANSDLRSVQTSSQLAEGMISVALVVQALKRSTGREVPRLASEPGGKWRFFPGFNDYNKHTPTYDAFPSGHLATSMMTITVLAENYPEYPLIRPIGYGVMTLIGFQMINNGVHWASDYPLAIAIGYGLGKVAVSKGRKVVTTGSVPEVTSKKPRITNMTMVPMPIEKGGALFVVGKF